LDSIYEEPLVDLRELRMKNQAATVSTLKEEGLDAIIVTAEDSVRYLACEKLYHQNDWWQDHYAAVLTSNGQFWRDKYDPYGGEVGWDYSTPFVGSTIIPDRWAEVLKRVLQGFSVRGEAKIGLDQLSFNLVEQLHLQLPSTTFVPFMRTFLKQRAVKNDLEIELIREAARVTDIGMQTGLIVGSTPGVRQNEVFAKMLSAMTEAGSELTPHNSIIASGKETLKDFLISDRRIKEGELYRFDVGCMIEGYHGDAGRVGYCGRSMANRETRELYQASHGCLMAGIKKVRPGVRGSEIDAACRDYLKEAGYPTYKKWSGHGIGARECEYPLLAPRSELRDLEMELKPGMVIGIEPTAYKPDLAALVMEDMILVTENGFEKLTRTGYLDDLLS
jgi:Xaa-Pro aminopeptidase